MLRFKDILEQNFNTWLTRVYNLVITFWLMPDPQSIKVDVPKMGTIGPLGTKNYLQMILIFSTRTLQFCFSNWCHFQNMPSWGLSLAFLVSVQNIVAKKTTMHFKHGPKCTKIVFGYHIRIESFDGKRKYKRGSAKNARAHFWLSIISLDHCVKVNLLLFI